MKISEHKDLNRIFSLMDAMRDIRKLYHNQVSKMMKDNNLDITNEMLEVLYMLWEKDNIIQQEIVEKTNRTKASITSLIDNMTTRGLVQRNSDPNDRRNNLIVLTEEGELYQQKLMPLLEDSYIQIKKAVSDNELEDVTFLLRKIHKKMMG